MFFEKSKKRIDFKALHFLKICATLEKNIVAFTYNGTPEIQNLNRLYFRSSQSHNCHFGYDKC